MSPEVKRLRDPAIYCRNLAKTARSIADVALLEEIADEFDAEAEKEEEAARCSPPD